MFTRSHLQEMKRRYASMYAPLIEEKFEEHCGVCGEQGIEEVEVAESFELQATMALDDVGIKAEINRKGQVVIKKKDKKKAHRALEKSFKKGGWPTLKLEDIELDEEIFNWYLIKGNLEKGKVAFVGTEKQVKLKRHSPKFSGNYVMTKSRKDLKMGDKWKESMGVSEEVEIEEEVTEKDYDSLKRGDTVTIEYKGGMSSGKGTFKVTAKNIVGKAKVGKVTLQNVKNPRGVKYFLYKRGNKVSFAIGDMGASVVSYTKEEVEVDEARKPAKDIGLECQECGKRFRSKNPRYGVTKCPKCKSTDLDLAYGEEVEVDEARSKEDELELAKAIAAWKKAGGKVKKLPPGKKFKSLFKGKPLPRQEEVEEASTYRDRTKDDE